jgi:tetratricopeptide (TPR) repeat protein
MKAMTLFEMGKYSEALQLTFQSDQCKLLQISPQSPEMAWNYSDRSKIYAQIGDRSKAIDELKIALEIRQNSLGLENLLTIETQEELNVLLLK